MSRIYITLPLAALLFACGGETSAPAPDQTAPAAIPSQDEAGSISALPDWFPEDIYLPEDFRLQSQQKIGTRTFLLGGTSSQGFEALKEAYDRELEASGYDVRQATRSDENGHSIFFSGNGLESAQVWLEEQGDVRKLRIDFSRET